MRSIVAALTVAAVARSTLPASRRSPDFLDRTEYWPRPDVKAVLLLGCMLQVLVATGVILTAFQLIVFPPLIVVFGMVKWQSMGCLLGVVTFVTVPNVRWINWNDTGLFILLVITINLVHCALAMVTTFIRPIEDRSRSISSEKN
eukprot:jgi/Undpi1/1221/HiC_scaffold_108.g14135.m1